MTIVSLTELANKLLLKFGTKEKLIIVSQNDFDVESGEYESTEIEHEVLLAQISQKFLEFRSGKIKEDSEYSFIIKSPLELKINSEVEKNGVRYVISTAEAIQFKNTNIIYFVFMKLKETGY